MKGNRQPTADERNYVFRRVLYNTMVAAQGVSELGEVDESSSDDVHGTASDVEDFSFQEVNKLAALIMARNLDAFFFPNPRSGAYYKFDDDIYHSDFDLVGWSPDSQAELSPKIRERLHKIAGHIVASKPKPFRLNSEVTDTAVPLIQVACGFLVECIKQNKAKRSATATKYLSELNELLPDLGIMTVSTDWVRPE